MTIRVTMKETRCAGGAVFHTSGQSYDLADSVAEQYIQNKWATYVSGRQGGEVPVMATTTLTGWSRFSGELIPQRGNHVLLLGDSITYNCGATFNVDGGNDGRSWIAIANALAGAPLHIVRNAGVAGNTTAQILARLESDVFAYDFDRVILMCGTNDPGVLTLAQSKQNFYDIVHGILGKGYGVDVVIPPPKTWTLPAQASQLSHMLELFGYQRRLAAMTPGVRLIGDAYSALVSPTSTSGDWTESSASMDTTPFIHPNNRGSSNIGLAMYSELVKAYPPSNVLPVSAAETNANVPFELFSDPLMLATPVAPGGSFTGLVPTGWSSNALTGATAACAVVSSMRGIGNDIEITITASGAGSLSLKKTWSSALQNAFLANGPYDLRIGAAVKVVSGTNVTSAYLSALFGGPNPLSGCALSGPSSGPASLPAALLDKVMTQVSGDIPINAGLSNAGVFGSYSQLVLNVTFNAAGTAVVRFTAPFVRAIQ